jgi:predicted lipoprotein with Yx(FWY)xxD motif
VGNNPDEQPWSGDLRRTSDSREHEETNVMELTKQRGSKTRRVQVRRVTAAAVAVLGVSAVILAPDAAHASSHATKSVVISTAKNPKYGTILVSGKTLYTLKPSKVACTAKCLQIWPAVLLPKGVKKPTAGTGVSAAKLGTVKRAGGELQVTYAGKALYWFFEDTAAGQVKGVGTDTWGAWSVVVIKKPSSGSGGTTTTTSPSGGGGGF